MKIFVKTKPKSKKEYIKKIDQNHFIVAVKEIPEKGKANEAIVSAVADYFKKSTSSIKIISGKKSKLKTIEIK
jgi:uncharacterized protein (TIGR00251 family)